MADNLSSFQYYGLVGKSISDAGSLITRGFSAQTALELQAGGYGMSAEMLEVQAEQETINAEAQANTRMDRFNQTAAANVAITSAMGKTGENTTISDANLEAARKDVSLMRREGTLKNISARSGASSKRSAERQSSIAAEAAGKISLLNTVGSLASGVGSYSMLGGGSKPKGLGTKLMKGSNRTAANPQGTK